MTDLIFVQSSHQIDLTTWTFSCPNLQCCDMFVGVLATRSIKEALEEDKPDADLAWMYKDHNSDGFSGPPVEHPDTIYFNIPFGAHTDERVAFKTRISNLVNDFIDNFKDWSAPKETPPKIDSKYHELVKALARSLRESVERLEAACHE